MTRRALFGLVLASFVRPAPRFKFIYSTGVRIIPAGNGYTPCRYIADASCPWPHVSRSWPLDVLPVSGGPGRTRQP